MNKIEIKNWLVERNIRNFIIQPDLTVDVFQGLILQELETIPIQFGVANKYFNCSHGLLTSLKGSPTVANKDFYCSHNLLTSLEYAPKFIQGDLVCVDNPIKDLVGFQSEFTGHLYHIGNPIRGLEHLYKPLKVDVEHGINPEYANRPHFRQLYVKYEQIKEIMFYQNLQEKVPNKNQISVDKRMKI